MNFEFTRDVGLTVLGAGLAVVMIVMATGSFGGQAEPSHLASDVTPSASEAEAHRGEGAHDSPPPESAAPAQQHEDASGHGHGGATGPSGPEATQEHDAGHGHDGPVAEHVAGASHDDQDHEPGHEGTESHGPGNAQGHGSSHGHGPPDDTPARGGHGDGGHEGGEHGPEDPRDVDPDSYADPDHPAYDYDVGASRTDRYLIDELYGCHVDHPYLAWMLDTVEDHITEEVPTLTDALVAGYIPMSPVPNDFGYPDTYWHWWHLGYGPENNERDEAIQPHNWIEYLLLVPSVFADEEPSDVWTTKGVMFAVPENPGPELYPGCNPFHNHDTEDGDAIIGELDHMHVWPDHHVTPLAMNPPHLCDEEGNIKDGAVTPPPLRELSGDWHCVHANPEEHDHGDDGGHGDGGDDGGHGGHGDHGNGDDGDHGDGGDDGDHGAHGPEDPRDADPDTYADPDHPAYDYDVGASRTDRYAIDELYGCHVDHPYMAWLTDTLQDRIDNEFPDMASALIAGYIPMSPIPNDFGYPDTYWHWWHSSFEGSDSNERDDAVRPHEHISYLLLVPSAFADEDPVDAWTTKGVMFGVPENPGPELYPDCAPFHNHGEGTGGPLDFTGLPETIGGLDHMHFWPDHHVNPLAMNPPHLCNEDGSFRAPLLTNRLLLELSGEWDCVHVHGDHGDGDAGHGNDHGSEDDGGNGDHGHGDGGHGGGEHGPEDPRDVDPDSYADPDHPAYDYDVGASRTDRYAMDELLGCHVDHPYVAWLTDTVEQRIEQELPTMRDALAAGYIPMSPIPNDFGYPDTYWHWWHLDHGPENNERDEAVQPHNWIEYLLLVPSVFADEEPSDVWTTKGVMFAVPENPGPELYPGCNPFHNHQDETDGLVELDHMHFWPDHHITPFAMNPPHLCDEEGNTKEPFLYPEELRHLSGDWDCVHAHSGHDDHMEHQDDDGHEHVPSEPDGGGLDLLLGWLG